MKTRGAVLHSPGGAWEVEEFQLDPPRAGEVLVAMKAAGICHSDEHMRQMPAVPPEVAKELGMALQPMVGGHEGSGTIMAVGAGVTSVQEGDHVAMSFMPLCGRCHWCLSGRAQLCDNGARLMLKGSITDGTSRHHLDGEDLNPVAKLGTWSEHTVVAESSTIKIDPKVPFGPAALCSCGVSTGFGSAVDRAKVTVGDCVVVVGCGGVGSNAVQGARISGARWIVAVDPVEMKRTTAQMLGATHVYSSMEDALPELAALTWGRLADKVIITVGEMRADLLAPAMALAGKDGTVVVTAMGSTETQPVPFSFFDLTMWNKSILGCLYGSRDPRVSVNQLLGLYTDGILKLDELITKTFPLSQVNDAIQAMLDGEVIRAVLTFDS